MLRAWRPSVRPSEKNKCWNLAPPSEVQWVTSKDRTNGETDGRTGRHQTVALSLPLFYFIRRTPNSSYTKITVETGENVRIKNTE